MDFENFQCPRTSASLSVGRDELVCDSARYPIKKHIPRFVESGGYAEAFGLQWNTFKLTQFDSTTGQPITEARLRDALGRDLSCLQGKKVIEAGSGAGRFTEILLKHGAIVYSFDMSAAVDANFENNMPHPNLTLFQADIEQIPFPDNYFDTAICLGVLQHTPNTTRSLKELLRVLKPNGELACDHYKYHLGMFSSMYLIYWLIIKRLSPQLQLKVTDQLTKVFFPIHWRFREMAVVQLLLRRISPINFYYGIFHLPASIQYEWSRLDTHDRNTDYYKRHLTRKQFLGILKGLNFREVTVKLGGTGYVANAIK